MHGWEELAQHVSTAYLTIPEPERATTVAFVTNYGEAARSSSLRADTLATRHLQSQLVLVLGTGATPITTFIRLAEAAKTTSKPTATSHWREFTSAPLHAV